MKKNTIKGIAFTLVLIAAILSCQNFYKVSKASEGALKRKEVVDSLKKGARYFILRSGDNAYHMKNIVLSSDQKTVSCTLDSLDIDHMLHLEKGHGKLRYLKNNPYENKVMNEVHFYTRYDKNAVAGGSYTLPLEQVEKIEILEFDKARTSNSYVLGAVGITLGALAVAGIIIAATKSSCPFVSAYDGHQFLLQGEIYGGAIYPQLARRDYVPLQLSPMKDGALRIKISNELKEKQFTDATELWAIKHDRNTIILSDDEGYLYSISNPQAPVYASLNGKRDVLSALVQKEDNNSLHMDDTSRADARNDLILRFANTGHGQKGKLVLRLKNDYWLDLLYGELAKGFGNYYNTYLEKQKDKTASELYKWVIEQQIPLTVSMRITIGWETVKLINTTGPLAFREMVIPLDLPATAFTEIKLSSGFMFWEVDQASLDTSPDAAFTLERLKPDSAIDERGIDVTNKLLDEDGKYLAQPNIGDVTTLTFRSRASGDKDKATSYILAAKGYYQHVRDYTNAPNVSFLKQFTKPNALPVYGKELYRYYQEESHQLFAKAH